MAASRTVVVGLDCATDPRKVGLACAVMRRGAAEVQAVEIGAKEPAVEEVVAGWIEEHGGAPALIAFDAPLGWPSRLGSVLSRHAAGSYPDAGADEMFRRRTDDIVYRHFKKRPLDVGADRIARCAHAALRLLDRLRRRLAMEIPMAWEPGAVEGVAAIEVYPAATLASRGWPSQRYKGTEPAARRLRGDLAKKVGTELGVTVGVRGGMEATDHMLDAVVCVLAAVDFLRGDVIKVEDETTARREGWIWVRPSGARRRPKP